MGKITWTEDQISILKERFSSELTSSIAKILGKTECAVSHKAHQLGITRKKTHKVQAHNRLKLDGCRFGRLTVISESDKRAHQKTYWKCKCDCGSQTVVCGSSLLRGNTRSCGCLKDEECSKRLRTHGLTKTRAYATWRAMLARCNNASVMQYKDYGGRGITVCDRWLKFENFVEDLGFPPVGMSIDRIDNNGNYEPSNCRWASRETQSRNTRRNRNISFNGETLPLIEWAQRLDIDQSSLRERLEKWSKEEALTKPKRGK